MCPVGKEASFWDTKGREDRIDSGGRSRARSLGTRAVGRAFKGMSWGLPCGPVFHLLCGWSGARVGMCFLGLMAWAQRPSGAVSGMWRTVRR